MSKSVQTLFCTDFALKCAFFERSLRIAAFRLKFVLYKTYLIILIIKIQHC